MKITKFVHSCLLVEDQGKTFLIDPGNYTAESKLLDITTLEKLDYILITHEHQDHMDISFIKEILLKFPQVAIITNDSAKEKLFAEGVLVSQEVPSFIKMEEVPHEKIFGVTQPPKNILVTIDDMLTDPGDSLSFNKTTKVLALPIQAPWGDTTRAAELASKLKPEVIIPIHDWHWNDQAREGIYKRLEDFFAQNAITFIPLQNGVPVEV